MTLQAHPDFKTNTSLTIQPQDILLLLFTFDLLPMFLKSINECCVKGKKSKKSLLNYAENVNSDMMIHQPHIFNPKSLHSLIYCS